MVACRGLSSSEILGKLMIIGECRQFTGEILLLLVALEMSWVLQLCDIQEPFTDVPLASLCCFVQTALTVDIDEFHIHF